MRRPSDPDLTVKQGDNAPAYVLTIARDGVPVDLTGATVTARYARTGRVAQWTSLLDVHDDPAAGQVVLDWPPGTLDQAGRLRVVLVGEWDDGARRETWPSAGFLLVAVSQTLTEETD